MRIKKKKYQFLNDKMIMKKTNHVEIQIEELKEACKAFKLDETQESYYISYIEFLEHFKKINEFGKHDVIIGIHLIYGWMPTICHLKSKAFDEAAKILNKVKKDNQLLLKKTDLDTLKKLFNESIVGTSKLLHFISPETYPIWDSKVCHYLGLPANAVNDTSVYLGYIEACRNIIGEGQIDLSTVKGILKDYKISDMRAIELVMFTSEKKGGKSQDQLVDDSID